MTFANLSDLRIVEASSEHIELLRSQWVPHALFKEMTDPEWNWQFFGWDEIIVFQGFYTVAVVCDDGSLEGLMAVQLTRGTIPKLKVAFLSCAPWNHGLSGKRRGIGTALLAHAVQLSYALGCGGAITLSSTKQSEWFYERKGFTDTKEKDHEGLKIYELSATAAMNFLANVQTIQAAL